MNSNRKNEGKEKNWENKGEPLFSSVVYLCNEFGLYSLRPGLHMKLGTEKIRRIMWN